MRWALAVLVMLLAVPFAPAPASGAEARVEPISIVVEGEVATGLTGIPAGEPRAIVLILHGYGHTSESHRGHLQALAERGAMAVAMDYRGPTTGFPLRAGAADSCAAFLPLHREFWNVPSILYSVSMGTAVAAQVFEKCPVFDHWVNNEGLAMLHETWAGAAALSPSGNPTAVNAKNGIEAECGGTPATQPVCYAERSMALRVDQIPWSCLPYSDCRPLRGVHLTHGLHDGLVPYDQGREMVAALRANLIPADFYTVVRGEACQEGTTLLGYAGVSCTGLAGHGSESNDAHTLTKLSFGLLYALVDGTLPPAAGRELVVDAGLGTLP